MKLIIPLSVFIIIVTLFIHLNLISKDLNTNSKPESALALHVIGDFGQFYPVSKYSVLPCKQVAYSMNKRASTTPISMILSTGDNFYVKDDSIKLFSVIKSIFTEVFNGKNIENVPWYLSYGNHDMIGKVFGDLLGELYPNVHMPSGSWNMTKVMIGYKIDFTILQTDIICHKEKDNYVIVKQCKYMNAKNDYSEVYKWLENHFKDLDSDPEVLWRIVVLHYPIFSVSTTGLDSENLKIYLLPLLRKYKVDLVLSGHNHNMQYFVSHHQKHANYVKQRERKACLATAAIKCGVDKIYCLFRNATCEKTKESCAEKISVESNSGLRHYNKDTQFKKGEALHQVIQGGGGADLNPFCPNMVSPMADYIFSKAEHGFTELKITNSGMYIQYISAWTSEVIFKSSILI